MVIVPSQPADDAGFRAHGQRLFGNSGSDYVCGVNSHPHITIAQFDITSKQLPVLRDVLASFAGMTFDIAMRYVYIKPRATDASMGLGTVFHAALQNFHDTVVRVAGVAGFVPRGKHGAAYWPHLTLAILQDERGMTANDEGLKIFFDRTIPFAATHGYTGAMGQFLGSGTAAG